MLLEWRKFKGWAVLEYFLSRPGAQIHIKELARELDISPQTSNRYLRLYEAEKLLLSENIGNVVRFCLNNSHPLVRELKRMYITLLFHENNVIHDFTRLNQNMVYLILYGSHASGEYSYDSDIEILAISNGKIIDRTPFEKLEKHLDKEVKINIYTIDEWKKLLNRNDEFTGSMVRNHVLLFGDGDEFQRIERSQIRKSTHKGLKQRANDIKMDYVYEEE